MLTGATHGNACAMIMVNLQSNNVNNVNKVIN